MVDRGGQVQEGGAELLTPAEMAGRIAAGLARLAELAAAPHVAEAAPAFAGVLDAMRENADELAALLAEGEAAEEDAGEETPATRDGEQIGALPAHARAAPLTFDALSRAVEVLTLGAQTPPDPSRLARPAPTVMDYEAIEIEERSRVRRRRLEAEAVATVQAATRALHAFLSALRSAKALHDARGEQPPSAVATGAAAEAAAAFVRAFMDRADLAAPFGALADMLLDVQVGGHKPRFSRAAKAKDNRHTAWWRATAMGDAAIALDARWRAAKLEAEAQGTRPPKIGRMALAVAEAVAPAFPQGERSKRVLAGRVVGWRVQAMAGQRGVPKGFKAGHPALQLWAKYRAAVVENPHLGGRWGPPEWVGFAERTETRIRTESGLKRQGPDEDLGGVASASARRAS